MERHCGSVSVGYGIQLELNPGVILTISSIFLKE
jgi:hypothetical protein